MSERNPEGGLRLDQPGGYQRDAGETFGAGTIRLCDPCQVVTKGANYYYGHAFSEDEPDGTRLCVNCGKRYPPLHQSSGLGLPGNALT